MSVSWTYEDFHFTDIIVPVGCEAPDMGKREAGHSGDGKCLSLGRSLATVSILSYL